MTPIELRKLADDASGVEWHERKYDHRLGNYFPFADAQPLIDGLRQAADKIDQLALALVDVRYLTQTKAHFGNCEDIKELIEQALGDQK